MFTYYILQHSAHSEEILDVWIGERILLWILRMLESEGHAKVM